jgi:hypothetical protein
MWHSALACYTNYSGLVILYTLRVNMSVAAQQMRVDLNWTETEKGYVLVRVLPVAVTYNSDVEA